LPQDRRFVNIPCLNQRPETWRIAFFRPFDGNLLLLVFLILSLFAKLADNLLAAEGERRAGDSCKYDF
jgi:hypothetical protein